MDWVREVIQRVDTALIGVVDPVEKRRLTVYRLRTLGYMLEDIAEELNCSYGTVRRDLEWCFTNLPTTYANAEEFRRIAIPQLEYLFRMLVTPRTIVESTDTGETVTRVEPPELTAIKVAASIKAEQAKLLGAYRAVDVQDGEETTTYTVTVSKPRFEIEEQDEQVAIAVGSKSGGTEL